MDTYLICYLVAGTVASLLYGAMKPIIYKADNADDYLQMILFCYLVPWLFLPAFVGDLVAYHRSAGSEK